MLKNLLRVDIIVLEIFLDKEKYIRNTTHNNMFPDTPQPKCKHPVSGFRVSRLSALSGHLKALRCREHETLDETFILEV